MLLFVFLLVNTWHALGLSVFLMEDTLTFFRCHLQAMKVRSMLCFLLLEH